MHALCKYHMSNTVHNHITIYSSWTASPNWSHFVRNMIEWAAAKGRISRKYDVLYAHIQVITSKGEKQILSNSLLSSTYVTRSVHSTYSSVFDRKQYRNDCIKIFLILCNYTENKNETGSFQWQLSLFRLGGNSAVKTEF